MGLAKCQQLSTKFSKALDILNQLSLKTPNLIEITIEKMKLLLTLDWDLFNNVVIETLTMNAECLEAIRYQILKLLCLDGQYNRVKLLKNNLKAFFIY